MDIERFHNKIQKILEKELLEAKEEIAHLHALVDELQKQSSLL